MKQSDGNSMYRRQIQKETEKISMKEVFGTKAYLDLLKSIAKELTNGKLDQVHLYANAGDGLLGSCDGRKVFINLENTVTESFLTVSQKNVSLVGVLGHECGHKNYSDFGLRGAYLEGFLKGLWYPSPPKAETTQEEQDLLAMKTYFEKKDVDALSLIMQVAAYMQNLLEDVYIEERMCERFPGSIRQGILMNRSRNVEWIPTLRELLADGEDALTILMNLCAQYALSGRVNNWDLEESELLETLRELMPLMDRAVVDANGSARFIATNSILLKIWRYLQEVILQTEERKKVQEETERADQPEENSSKGSSSKNEGAEQKEKGGQGISTAMQEYLVHFAEHTPDLPADEEKPSWLRGVPKDVRWRGTWQANEDTARERSAGQEERRQGGKSRDAEGEDSNMKTGESSFHIQIINAESGLQEILWQMAKERVDAKINREVNLQLQKEMDEICFDAGHEKVKKKVCRNYHLTEAEKLEYEKYVDKVKRVKKQMQSSILPILQNQGARTEKRLLMGRKVDLSSIANPNGAIYCKHYPGKKLDIALALLIDMSGSMQYVRSEQAKLAALCLYEFCRQTQIPITVYGHHTDGYRHKNLEDETVYLHSCAEFEPDKNDGYRIASLVPDGANRDGVAIRFVGEKLLKRPEKQKLMILISDGFPNSNQYRGEEAKKDLISVKKNFTRKGIVFLAAAIGSDKERIREIYQDAFLDISQLEKLPAMLTKQVLRYIRRY